MKVTKHIMLFMLLLQSYSSELLAVPKIKLNAVLNNAVVLTIDGRQQMLTVNQSSTEGYKLLKINQNNVVIKVDGIDKVIALGAAIGPSKSAPIAQVLITKDIQGMYQVDGRINDHSVRFLVDTGATFIALNSQLASQLNIDYRAIGRETIANTAAGQVPAWHIKLTKVTLGNINIHQVDAVVIEGAFPDPVLLGMSFLGRLNMNDNGMLLTLEKKY